MTGVARRPMLRKDKEVGGTFRIVVGSHTDFGPVGCDCDDCYHTSEEEKKANGGRGANHVYNSYDTHVRSLVSQGQREPFSKFIKEGYIDPNYRNDIIETEADLCARFNMGPNSVKFFRITGGNATDSAQPYTGGVPPIESYVSSLTPEELDRMSRVIAQAKQGKNTSVQAAMTGEQAKPIASTTTAQVATNKHDLSTMTVEQLKAFAEEMEVDIKGAKTKEELIKVIKSS